MKTQLPTKRELKKLQKMMEKVNPWIDVNIFCKETQTEKLYRYGIRKPTLLMKIRKWFTGIYL